jgi:hypothetical protein
VLRSLGCRRGICSCLFGCRTFLAQRAATPPRHSERSEESLRGFSSARLANRVPHVLNPARRYPVSSFRAQRVRQVPSFSIFFFLVSDRGHCAALTRCYGEFLPRKFFPRRVRDTRCFPQEAIWTAINFTTISVGRGSRGWIGNASAHVPKLRQVPSNWYGERRPTRLRDTPKRVHAVGMR